MDQPILGKWISNSEFAGLRARDVFHRQLEPTELDCSTHRDRHILFRKTFSVDHAVMSAKLRISADDYYKLYINGRFVAQGPAPSYHFQYNFNEIDVTDFLTVGENCIAVHTLYQGLINRVWQSGDLRHGMICNLIADNTLLLCSDETFRVRVHTGYSEMGVCGYQTQFMERYDSRADEVGFEQVDFDDSAWDLAEECRFDDHILTEQRSRMLTFEQIAPKSVTVNGNRILYDFGSSYVGYLSIRAHGDRGDRIMIRCAQELNEDGQLRFELRANCRYEEEWILSGADDLLDQFDYKSFRYAELELPATAQIDAVCLVARHYPFALKARLKPIYAEDAELRRIWELCVHSQRLGVQEVIQDCMDREKGFYLGDGCYTALTHMLLTDDDSMVRKLIDDAFATSRICDTLMTCLDCSFMQEIAEFPLILIALIRWHYRYTRDADYLRSNYRKATALMDAYRRDYEQDGLLRSLDKWCIVEWPMNYQHGYDADIREGKVCAEAHVAINAYYLYAVRLMNAMAKDLGERPYRDEQPLLSHFYQTFYDAETGLFRDSEHSEHKSLVGNAFVYSFALCPNAESRERILEWLDRQGISALALFCTFPVMMRLAKDGDEARIRKALTDEGVWRRMLREDATTTFEGWGKDTKWNTSLFHLTMSYAAVFLSDTELRQLFE